ncbi:hypothetical protein ACFYOT_30485 [Saccharothrix saharensis]|uniref:hypothetical protein n=1 Tax=Saccharothrix saharensis TaxID=571190 RepID=UPI0036B09478
MHDHRSPEPTIPDRVVRRSGSSAAGRRESGPVDALALQRTVGNAVVTRLLGHGDSVPGGMVVQRGKANGGRRDKGKELAGKGGKGKGRKGKGGKGGRGKAGVQEKEKETEERGQRHDVEGGPEYPGTLPQKEIQMRMLYACVLLDNAHGLGAGVELAGWSSPATVNGLCGGWATLHRLHPDWLPPLWRSLSEWQPAGDRFDPVPADLGALVVELKKRSVDSSPGREVAEVARALVRSWAVMHELEPGAEYGKPPSALLDLVGEPEMTDKWTHHGDRFFTVTCRIDEAGPRAARMMRESIGRDSTTPEYYFHGETARHHFGVHVAKGRWTVCEPAHFGVAQINVEDLARVLALGFAEGFTPANDGDAEWSRPKVGTKPAEEIAEMNDRERSEYHRSIAARKSELRDWRAARDELKIDFEVRTYTRR